MISGTEFAKRYTSLWQGLAPTAEVFVRRINSYLYQRIYPPMKTAVHPSRRGLINEVAFALYCLHINEHPGVSQPRGASWIASVETNLEAAIAIAINELPRLERTGSLLETGPDDDERRDIIEQVQRMGEFFNRYAKKGGLEASPTFPGCGFVDESKGDVLVSGALCEVKAGDRSFRVIDVRQLLVYLTLNALSRRSEIRSVGLFNPRSGVAFRAPVQDFCKEAGRPEGDLYEAIARAMSSGEISR